MSRFKVYSPDQAYLLPPSVRDELGEKHLCFFVREVIERLDMSVFEQSYSAEGGELYAPQLMLGVWLYAYALGITSARQVERRLVEDLAFRYLAAGERVDNWALSAFRRRHSRALNDAFTQVLEWAQSQGMVKLGRVAIDSTRIAANASRDRVDTEQALRDTRARLRRQVRAWQKAADRDDQEPGGLEVAIGGVEPGAGRDAAAHGAAEEKRLEEAFAHRRGRALSAPARRQVRARLLGRNHGLRRPPDRGPAGDAERHRQRIARSRCWTRPSSAAARRRARLWPTADSFRSTTSNRWNSATSTPMCRTPTWRGH